MADWNRLQLIDNVDLHEDAQGSQATARFRMAAVDRELRPRRGDPADPLVPGWFVDKVAVTAYTPHHDYVSITARPRLGVGASFRQRSLRGVTHIRYLRRDLLFTSALMGVQPVPPRPGDGADWIASGVDLSAGVPGHVPIQRDPTHPDRLLDWPAAALQPPAACPFVRVPAWGLHQQALPCETATITFHVRANFIHRYLDFRGVTDGAAEAVPARFRLPDATGSGIWRAVDQSIETISDSEGHDFWKIVRHLQRVPPVVDATGQPLRWAPAKHGGAMRWQHS